MGFQGTIHSAIRNGVVPEVIDAVERLKAKGIKNAIATRSTPEVIESQLGKENFALFSNNAIWTSSKTALVEDALEQSGFDESEVVFVDDMKHNLRDVKEIFPMMTTIHVSKIAGLLSYCEA